MAQPRILSSVEIEFQGQSQARALMERAGFAVEVRHPQPGWPDEETRSKLAGFDALLAGGENLNADTMDRAAQLKIIARNGVGFDKVDLDYCTQRGIVVTNTPGAMADAVADLTFALLLGMVRSLRLGDQRVKAEDTYDVPVGEDLGVMTLGLVGCGRIGAEVVRRARGFKMQVLVHDPYIDDAQIRALGAEPADRAALLSQADAVTLHLPLTEENRQLVNAEFLGLMKEGAYLINTARGGLVDEAALIAALDRGHLAGAGLDCQASEPPQGQSLELVRRDKVLALPHTGSKTLSARKRMALVAAQSIVALLQGRVPDHVVNREVLDKLDLAGERSGVLNEDRVPAKEIHDEARERHGEYYRSIGYYLRLYRQRADLTQAALAKRSGIRQHHLSEMENNKRVLGKVNAKKLAEILDCDYRKLL